MKDWVEMEPNRGKFMTLITGKNRTKLLVASKEEKDYLRQRQEYQRKIMAKFQW